MESEFVPIELEERARGLGFGDRSYVHLIGKEPNHSHFSTGSGSIDWGITLEQLERWIWNEHRKLFPTVYLFMHSGKQEKKWCVAKLVDEGNMPLFFPDPFSARLAGVERVIEILEQRQK